MHPGLDHIDRKRLIAGCERQPLVRRAPWAEPRLPGRSVGSFAPPLLLSSLAPATLGAEGRTPEALLVLLTIIIYLI